MGNAGSLPPPPPLLHLPELDQVVELLRLLAGQRVVLVVAGERLLVEARPVRAEERPVARRQHRAGVVLHREADVEQLRGGLFALRVSLRVSLRVFAHFCVFLRIFCAFLTRHEHRNSHM